ncbi:MAG: helix-turn-helix domain-containing protein [Mangrovibacterium sp.]
MFLDKKLIFSRLKFAYGLTSDSKLSHFLGIPPTTLASWKARNTFDFDILYSKCEGLSWDYLVYGIGEPFIKNESNQDARQPGGNFDDELRDQLHTLTEEIKRLTTKLEQKDPQKKQSK